MTPHAPLTPRPPGQLPPMRRVMTTEDLRVHGVTPAEAEARCRPGGGWRTLLPGVHLLHSGEPTSEDRLRAALLYATGPAREHAAAPRPMITGLAALAVYGFSSVPTLRALDSVDVLVDGAPAVRSTPGARVVRCPRPPEPVLLAGLPLAPVARALADAVGQLADRAEVRRLLVEAVRGAHCDERELMRELAAVRALALPRVAEAADAFLAEGQALAEGRLYALVREEGLPDPCWNVELRLPGGALLGGVDAYWPDHAVAVEVESGLPREVAGPVVRVEPLGKRELLERLGVMLLRVAPKELREQGEHRVAAVRAALVSALERESAVRLTVTPR